VSSVKEIGGFAAWLAADMDTADWKIELDDSHVAELTDALERIDRTDTDLRAIRRDDFPLPTLSAVLDGLVDELVDGRGFVLVRGVPIESLTERQAELMAWGIGRHIGIAIRQGAQGNLLAHVRDEGVDPSSPLTRGYQTRTRLNYHTDSSDVVALLCIRPAKRGGVSTINSAVSVHNEIVRRRADLAAMMYEPWWHDRRRGDGPDSFFQCPIYAVNEADELFAYYGPDYIRSASRGPGIPPLTERQLEAIELLDELNNEPRFVLNMNFQPGDMQFLNNYRIMHARTAYEDHAEPDRKRDLVRLWFTLDRDLGLPASFAERGLVPRSAAFER
jgi:hypothetical protein